MHRYFCDTTRIMQHVLIPTDFSKNAWNATTYALLFFKNQKVVFHFLHIQISRKIDEDHDLQNTEMSTKKNISEEIKHSMKKWIQQVHTCCPNAKHTFKKQIVQTSFTEGIRAYIKDHNIEFIVMGAKGASRAKEVSIGSRTGAVITRIKCPILVIPEAANFKKPLQIGFPTDFNMLKKDRVLETLLTIADTNKSSIKVLRVAQNNKPLDDFQNKNRDHLKEILKDIPHSFHLIENKNLENTIQSFVTTMQIDLLAMVAKNLNFYQRILFKPQGRKISYHITTPFLILHE